MTSSLQMFMSGLPSSELLCHQNDFFKAVQVAYTLHRQCKWPSNCLGSAMSLLLQHYVLLNLFFLYYLNYFVICLVMCHIVNVMHITLYKKYTHAYTHDSPSLVTLLHHEFLQSWDCFSFSLLHSYSAAPKCDQSIYFLACGLWT